MSQSLRHRYSESLVCVDTADTDIADTDTADTDTVDMDTADTDTASVQHGVTFFLFSIGVTLSSVKWG